MTSLWYCQEDDELRGRSMSQWYCIIDGEEQGPVDGRWLTEAVRQNHLLPTDMVRKDGRTRWVEARKIKGLFPAEPSSVDSSARQSGKKLSKSKEVIKGVLAVCFIFAVTYYFFLKPDPEKPIRAQLDDQTRIGRAVDLKRTGATLHGERKYLNAIQKYTEALELDPNDGEIYLLRGYSYFNYASEGKPWQTADMEPFFSAKNDFTKAESILKDGRAKKTIDLINEIIIRRN